MKDTGERLIAKAHEGSLTLGEHLVRYHSVLPLIEGAVVLDIACGAGYGSDLLATRATKVYGFDISTEAVDYAKAHYPSKKIEFRVSDATKIDLPDGGVDRVVSFETIEHVKDYDKFVREVKRVLKPGGQFIVSTPNDKEFPPGNHFHFHQFVLPEFKEFLDKHFKNVDIYYQGTWYATGLLAKEDMDGRGSLEGQVLKSVKEKPEQAVYFLAICSDAKPSKIDKVFDLSDRYSAKLDQANSQQLSKDIANLQNETLRLTTLTHQQVDELTQVQYQLNSMIHSRAWRLVLKLKKIKARLHL